MPDVDLFKSLAEIAGVFVGFGALIAVRSRRTMEVGEINSIRWVLTTGIWVVITALAPAIVSSYGLAGHDLWRGCGILALVLLAAMFVVIARTPENLADVDAIMATVPPAKIALVTGLTLWLPLGLIVLALGLAVLGLFPDQERALYLTAVGLGLLMGALGLFVAVFWRRSPSVPSGRVSMPPPGGPGA